MKLIFYGKEIQLDFGIVDYEFPKSQDDIHDRNWLNVSVKYTRISDRQVLKTNVDPCLLSWELVQIRDHFKIASGRERRLDFMEPEIEFVFYPAGSVRIEVRHGLRFGAGNAEAYSTGPLSLQERNQYVAAWSRLCVLFPRKM